MPSFQLLNLALIMPLPFIFHECYYIQDCYKSMIWDYIEDHYKPMVKNLHRGEGKFLLCRVESTGAAQESEQEDAQRRRARDAGPPHDPLLLGRMKAGHRAMQLHPSRNRCA